jgi:hypothetical protein
MKAHRRVGLGVIAALIASHAVAGQYIYPTQGQDRAKQTKDEADCSAWATQQTGFDPAKAPAAPAGGAGLSGSTVAAAMGAIPGTGGLGSAAGMLGGAGGQASSVAALGGLAGGVGGQAATASQALGMLNQVKGGQQQPAKPSQADYDQARAACLSGRGYSVR